MPGEIYYDGPVDAPASSPGQPLLPAGTTQDFSARADTWEREEYISRRIYAVPSRARAMAAVARRHHERELAYIRGLLDNAAEARATIEDRERILRQLTARIDAERDRMRQIEAEADDALRAAELQRERQAQVRTNIRGPVAPLQDSSAHNQTAEITLQEPTVLRVGFNLTRAEMRTRRIAVEQARVAADAYARTRRIKAERAENDSDVSLARRYSRSCTICYTPNPLRRAVMVACGHMMCSPCAEEAQGSNATLSCPFCRKTTNFIKIFEDEAEEEEEERQSPSKRRRNEDNDDDDKPSSKRIAINL